jgi:hypothetical protein
VYTAVEQYGLSVAGGRVSANTDSKLFNADRL